MEGLGRPHRVKGRRVVALTSTKKEWLIVCATIRYVGMIVLVLALGFSIINPILGVVLILPVAFGSNLALRLLVEVSFRSLVLYAVYVGAVLGLAGLWLLSVISAGVAAIVLVPIAVSYWILSWYAK